MCTVLGDTKRGSEWVGQTLDGVGAIPMISLTGGCPQLVRLMLRIVTHSPVGWNKKGRTRLNQPGRPLNVGMLEGSKTVGPFTLRGVIGLLLRLKGMLLGSRLFNSALRRWRPFRNPQRWQSVLGERSVRRSFSPKIKQAAVVKNRQFGTGYQK